MGSCRRELLDHVTALSERHLKRLMREYIRYCHEDRTHLSEIIAASAVRMANTNENETGIR